MSKSISTFPDKGFVRFSDLIAYLPISKTTLYRWSSPDSKNNFPQPIKLSSKTWIWDAALVSAWLNERANKTLKVSS